MNSVPATSGMTLREACEYFGKDGIPLPDTTLRDLLKSEGIATRTERRQSQRGVRPMVVIPPESLQVIAEYLSPEAREPLESNPREIKPTLGDLEIGERDLVERIAELETRLAEALSQSSGAAETIVVAKKPKRAAKRLARRLLEAVRSPAAVRTVFVLRIVSCAVVWLLLPEQISRALAPRIYQKPAANNQRPLQRAA